MGEMEFTNFVNLLLFDEVCADVSAGRRSLYNPGGSRYTPAGWLSCPSTHNARRRNGRGEGACVHVQSVHPNTPTHTHTHTHHVYCAYLVTQLLCRLYLEHYTHIGLLILLAGRTGQTGKWFQFKSAALCLDVMQI